MDLKDGHFLRAMTQTRDLAKLALEGLQYYHKYNRLYLSAVMAVGFLGWIINILLELAEDRKQNLAECTRSSKKMLRGIRFVFGMAVCVVLILLYLHAAPAMHYMYCLLPFPLWYNILIKRRAIAGLCAWRVHSSKTWLLLRRSLTTIILIEIMTLAFFHRWVLSILLVAGAILSFVIVYRRTGHLLSMRCCLWSAALLVMAIFPLLPVISGNENYALVALAGLFSGAVGLSYTFLFPPKSRSEAVPLIATVAIVLCTALRLHTAHSVHSGFGLPKLNQLLSWTLLTILPFLPLWSKPMLIERLLCIFLSLVSVYILTSIYYEALFFVCLTITMFLWIWIEKFFVDLKIADSFIGLTQNSQTNVAYNEDNHELDVLDHFRISNEFIFFILLAFFGTGNISSVNSFDPASLYCLVTIFSPFVMGAILIFKVLLPFLLVSCCFNAMRSVIKIDIRRIFLAVLASTDLMAINFFFRIRDEGSWLEIGSSLSHFIIVLSFIFFLFPIFELGGLFFFNIQRDGVKTHQF